MRFLILFLMLLTSSSTGQVLYVKPNDFPSQNCPGQPCLTLDQYTEHMETYFTTGATFLFLAGNHTLQTTVHLSNISKITFRGQDTDFDTIIMCRNELMIHSVDVTNLTIVGLAFVHYSCCVQPRSASLGIPNGDGVLISNSNFQQSRNLNKKFLLAIFSLNSSINILSCLFWELGGAITAIRSKITLTGNNFTDNKSNNTILAFNSNITLVKCLLKRNKRAIYVVKTDITLSGSKFIENKAMQHGGAILSSDSTILLVNCHLKRNTGGENGGAIAAINSSVTLTGNLFVENQAMQDGGAILAIQSTVMLKTSLGNTFTHNSAARSGGAFSCIYCNVSIKGNCNITVNHNNRKSVEKLTPTLNEPCTTNFFNNNARNFGGAVHILNSAVISAATLHFTNNRAEMYAGGAIYVTNSNLTLNLYQYFSNNSCTIYGGAIYAVNTTLKNAGNSYFENNRVKSGGGAVFAENSVLILSATGTASFIGNTANDGGAILLLSTTAIFNGTKIGFINNSGVRSGGAITSYKSFLVTETEQLNFIGNKAGELGGGISADGGHIVISANFVNNTAKVSGGALYLMDSKRAKLHNVRVRGNSDVALNILHSTVTVTGKTRFEQNAGTLAGAINAIESVLSFTDCTLFEKNQATFGGGISGWQSNITFNGVMLFAHNNAENGGAIYAYDTDITFNNTLNFTSNTALFGGAMYIHGASTLIFKPFTDLTTSHNHASMDGGAIYHADIVTTILCKYDVHSNFTSFFGALPKCFIDIKGMSTKDNITTSIYSYNDSAGRDGRFLYGGLLDRCRTDLGGAFSLNAVDNIETFVPYNRLINEVLHMESTDNETESVTSKPYQLCFCESDLEYQCNEVKLLEVHRGEKFSVSLLATAQGGIITPTLVTAKVSHNSMLNLNQNSQSLSRHCTELTYNVYSVNKYEQLKIYPDGPCFDVGLAAVTLNMTLLPCPDGFTQSREKCKRLQVYDADCIINESIYILRRAGSMFWMSALYVNKSYQGLILYKTCPVEYCTNGRVNITLSDQDDQCDQNRRGKLCGECKANYSLCSSKCQVCSNTYLALLLPFAAAGIALFVFLSFLRLTVATGMINSIILYANVVQANRYLFFKTNTRNILTVFIAWLNLDLGFQTCFYHGMDAYAQTWLQFVFPIYMWILIILIILTIADTLLF